MRIPVNGERGRTSLELAHLRPLQTAGELRALEVEAARDNHCVIGATHLVVRGKEIVGYASVGAVPMVFTWVHSEKVRARESLMLLNTVECLAMAQPWARTICVPCCGESPFRPYMEMLGYVFAGDTGLFLKGARETREIRENRTDTEH